MNPVTNENINTALRWEALHTLYSVQMLWRDIAFIVQGVRVLVINP